MKQVKKPASQVHAIIIIGSQSISQAYDDYSAATAYYHSLLQRGIPSHNIICLCNKRYFSNYQDKEKVKFQLANQQQREYPSIRDKFHYLDFQYFPKINDPEGIAYIILFNQSSKNAFGQKPNISYCQIFDSLFTSLNVSQIICIDSFCNSDSIINSYNKIQKSISKINVFPNEIKDELTSILFSFQSMQKDIIQKFQLIVGHLQNTEIAYLDKSLFSILLKIGKIYLSSQYPSFTHFTKHLKEVYFAQSYESFPEFEADALFVSKTKIEYRPEFLFINQIVSILSLNNALKLFNIALQPEYSSYFVSFIKCIQPDQTPANINLKPCEIQFQHFLTPITIFTSAESDNGILHNNLFNSSFRSTILDMLFLNPIPDINQETIQSYFEKVHDESGSSAQFFTSCSKPFSILNTEGDEQIISDSSSDSSSEIKIVQPIPEELFKFDPNDKIFYPYETDENRLEIPLEDYRAGQFFKQFYYKLNDMLTKNQLEPLRLYRESEMPEDFTLGVLQTWNDFNSKTSCYIQYVLVHQFDYYCYSFAYLFQNNWSKMRTFLPVFIDTLNELRATSEFTEYTTQNYPFDPFCTEEFLKECLYDVDFGYPFP